MAAHPLTASAVISAPPREVYEIIADYRDGHARIIPRPPFVSLEVEQGGRGAGTAIRVGIRLLGRVQHYRAVVSEPEPGRVLVETNENGYATSFTVDPRDGGRHALVTIATEIPRRPWGLGALERRLLARLLRPVYVRELEKLAEVAST